MKLNHNIIINLDDNNLVVGLDKIDESYIVQKEGIFKYLNNINTKLTNIQDKSFFRYPSLTLPRQKVDLLKEKYNIKITRNKDKADYKIISKKYIESMMDFKWSHRSLKSEYLLTEMQNNKSSFTNEGYQAWEHFLSNNLDNYISFKIHYRTYSTGFLAKLMNGECKKHISSENKKHVDEMFISNSYIFDFALSDIIYEGLHVLTREEYINAKQMIKSNDKDNLTLVMELLSNCNLNKSYDYVSMLFYFYYDQIRYSSNWNSVNVKSLRESLSEFARKYNNVRHGQYYQKYLKELKEAGYLTKFAVDQCSKFLYHNVIKYYGGVDEDSILKIDEKSIILDEQYNDSLITKEN